MGIQGTIGDWRRDHLARLSELERAGVTIIEWLTAGDKHVCATCAARKGRQFTIAQMRLELAGHFCNPGDPDDRCRCVMIAAQ